MWRGESVTKLGETIPLPLTHVGFGWFYQRPPPPPTSIIHPSLISMTLPTPPHLYFLPQLLVYPYLRCIFVSSSFLFCYILFSTFTVFTGSVSFFFTIENKGTSLLKLLVKHFRIIVKSYFQLVCTTFYPSLSSPYFTTQRKVSAPTDAIKG